MDEMDPVFKALADPHRRHLLDRLRERDGQTLTQLQAELPMTRFGVMKHLRVLEEAGLVASRKVGRARFHFLNPIPIQGVFDRWVSRYARPWSGALSSLKETIEMEQARDDDRPPRLESPPQLVSDARPPAHVYQIYIRTTPERLWQALTDPDWTVRYYFKTRVESDWRPGSSYIYRREDGAFEITGEILETDPPRRLVTTFRPSFVPPDDRVNGTTVTYEIEPLGEICKLTLIHDGLDPVRHQGIVEGWTRICSELKTLLETGEPLAISEPEG